MEERGKMKIYNKKQFAEMIHISVSTVNRYLNENKIPHRHENAARHMDMAMEGTAGPQALRTFNNMARECAASLPMIFRGSFWRSGGISIGKTPLNTFSVVFYIGEFSPGRRSQVPPAKPGA